MVCCELCERDTVLTSHHLIPKQVHSKNWCKKLFTRDEMKRRRLDLCNISHKALHRFYSHSELARRFNTLDLLLLSEKIINHIKWLKKQKI